MDAFEPSALVRTVLLPPAGPLILGVLGILLSRTVRFRLAGWVLCVTSIGSLWLLSTPVLAHQLTMAAAGTPALDLRRPVDAQAVVILAGGIRRHAPEYNEDAPGDATLQRIVYGAHVARATRLPVLVSGGRGEARAMTSFLSRELSTAPRWIEDVSRNTHENAVLSAEILERSGIDRIVLVTSATHMRRAAAEFRAHGLDIVPAPVIVSAPREGAFSDWVPSVGGLRESYAALYELVGYAVRPVRERANQSGSERKRSTEQRITRPKGA